MIHGARRFDVAGGCAESECELAYSGFHVVDLEPDVAAPLTPEAYLENRDPAMEAIENLLAGRSERRADKMDASPR